MAIIAKTQVAYIQPTGVVAASERRSVCAKLLETAKKVVQAVWGAICCAWATIASLFGRKIEVKPAKDVVGPKEEVGADGVGSKEGMEVGTSQTRALIPAARTQGKTVRFAQEAQVERPFLMFAQLGSLVNGARVFAVVNVTTKGIMFTPVILPALVKYSPAEGAVLRPTSPRIEVIEEDDVEGEDLSATFTTGDLLQAAAGRVQDMVRAIAYYPLDDDADLEDRAPLRTRIKAQMTSAVSAVTTPIVDTAGAITTAVSSGYTATTETAKAGTLAVRDFSNSLVVAAKTGMISVREFMTLATVVQMITLVLDVKEEPETLTPAQLQKDEKRALKQERRFTQQRLRQQMRSKQDRGAMKFSTMGHSHKAGRR